MRPEASPLVLTRELERQGRSRKHAARLVEGGTHVRLRSGVLVPTAVWAAMTHEEQHLLRIEALQSVAATRPVFSHWSAAALHGLPVLRAATDVHVTVPADRTRSRVGVRSHLLALDAADVEEQEDGLLRTSMLRTVVDIAASAAFEEAVVVADAALARLDETAKDALREVARKSVRASATKVEQVIAFADRRSGSPAESVSRVTMRVIGLRPPTLQFRVHHENGHADLDFFFEDEGVGGEVDGRAKYVDPLLNGGDPAAVVYREKLREDLVRGQGVPLVRWGWDVARSPARLARRLAIAGVRPH